MVRACTMHEREMHMKLWWDNLKKRDHWENLDIWENIKMALEEIVLESVDWIHLARNRGQCLAVVTMVMNLLVPHC